MVDRVMIRLFVRSLAAWRLTGLVVEDEVTRPLREAAQRRWPDSKISYLATCPRCVSVWASAVVLVLPAWLTRVLAYSAVTIAANEARDHASQRALQRRMTGGGVRREGETG